MAKRVTYRITWDGKQYKRTSESRVYTWAAVHMRDGRVHGVTWHSTQALARAATPTIRGGITNIVKVEG